MIRVDLRVAVAVVVAAAVGAVGSSFAGAYIGPVAVAAAQIEGYLRLENYTGLISICSDKICFWRDGIIRDRNHLRACRSRASLPSIAIKRGV